MVTEQFQVIPTQKGWPLLGVLPKLFTGDPFEYLKNIMVERGDLVQINFGPQPVYLVSHPDYLQRILRDNYQNYRKPDMLYKTGEPVIGNGLVLNSGDSWLRQRRMIQPHMHRKQLGNLFSDMSDAVTEVLNGWETLGKNETEIELGEKMGEMTMHVIARTMFGKETLPADKITEIGFRAARLLEYVGKSLFSGMLPKWVQTPSRRRFLEDLSATRETVNQIVAKCRQEKETSASLIQMLINSVDEESHQGMSEQQLFDEVMGVFLGGYETTATALIWFGVVIHEHPKILERLIAEVDQVLGSRTPSFEDVPNLTYARKVFMEILRMYTIAPFLPRALNKEDQLGNYRLPANALLLVFYHGVHHNPRVWDDPERFDPERFAPDMMTNRHPFAYVPFSAGPRKCVGDEFALLEGPLIMAMILQKYNIHVIPNQTFGSRMGLTMRPYEGVKATFSLRNSEPKIDMENPA